MTKEQINNIYANCNKRGVDMEELLALCLNPDSGITVKGLKDANYNKIDLLEERYKEIQHTVWAAEELKEWNAVKGSKNLADVLSFIDKIEDGIYSEKFLRDAQILAESMEWEAVKDSNDSGALTDYIRKYSAGNYPSTHVAEAEDLLEQSENLILYKDWNEVLAEKDLDIREDKIKWFTRKYNTKTSATVKKYLDKASQELSRIKEEKEAIEEWAYVTDRNEILGYLNFIKKYPSSSFREKAELAISNLKGNLLSNMKADPMRYSRVVMHEYISNNALTWKDLVEDSNVLTDKAFSHIRQYPTLKSEQRTLPTCKSKTPSSVDGNTDVFFFGVPGSGKSCVLAGLLAQEGNLGFKFDPRGQGGGGNYAIELKNYAFRSELPPKTDDLYIQVIDAEIKDEKGIIHNLSLIEMAGERTAQFATIEDPESLTQLGEGAEQLLLNNNNKIIFFVIDPTNEKKIIVDKAPDIIYMQSDMLNCISSLLHKNKSLMKKIVAIHVIFTKSDTLGDCPSPDVVLGLLKRQGYGAVLQRLSDICEKYQINQKTGREVGIYTFSLGKFMPGEVYTFDGVDSLKVLRVIQENSGGHINEDSFIKKLNKWFNS